MSLRIRQLTIRAATERGEYARTLPFGDGLTVIRGANSSGKSTCLMAMLYALGLEGMLTAKRQVPLPHALTEQLRDGDEEIPVLSSSVTLVVENSSGELLTLFRYIHGGDDTRLVRTWPGRQDANQLDCSQSDDYFVRDSGAAQRERGFHRMLSEFIGWTLPEVARFEGAPCPLYMECLFPLFFVEQKRGWLGLHARMPTHLRIREVQTHATAFLLGLSRDTHVRRRQELDARLRTLADEWKRHSELLRLAAKRGDAQIDGLPLSCSDAWPDAPPSIRCPEGGGWIKLREMQRKLRARLDSLSAMSVPSAGEGRAQHEADLRKHEEQLGIDDAIGAKLREELEFAELEASAASLRLVALKRDLQRNKDAKKLRELGSLSRLSSIGGQCPTCHQSTSDDLAMGGNAASMTLDENIAFIDDMIETVQAAGTTATRRGTELRTQMAALATGVTERRTQIRALRRSLIQDERAPSIAVVEELVTLRNLLERLQELTETFNTTVEKLRELHLESCKVQEEIDALARHTHSDSDRRTIQEFERLFVDQIAEYGLESFLDTRLSIDPTTLRPRADGLVDIEFELSGSDLIRAICAFYVALLETARVRQTNHPGLLVLDEPRQQGTAWGAIAAVLKRASESGKCNQQVIVASSEPNEKLRVSLNGVTYTQIDFAAKALVRVLEA